jgi:hypothetical protein
MQQGALRLQPNHTTLSTMHQRDAFNTSLPTPIHSFLCWQLGKDEVLENGQVFL